MKNSSTFQYIATDLIKAVQEGEVVYPMSVAPVADNDASGMLNWSIKGTSEVE